MISFATVTCFSRRASRANSLGMMTTKQEPQPPEKKKSNVEVRDLKPKKDPKAGSNKSQTEEQNRSGRTGEIDFMRGVD